MKRWFIHVGVAVVLLAVSLAGRLAVRRGLAVGGVEIGGGAQAGRIISFAPSITELLFALGLGERVVGVTRFCNYPAEVAGKARIGGYFDPNYEAIAAAAPDLIVLLLEHEEPRRLLSAEGRRVLTVNHNTLPGIIESIRQVGLAGGVSERAEFLAEELERRLAEVERRTHGRPRPRVLITVAREPGSGRLGSLYIAGKGNFYSRLLELAGGVNAYQGELPLPEFSAEGLLHLDPEVIVEILGPPSAGEAAQQAARRDWQSVPQLAAVRADRIHLFVDDFDIIPGPRIVGTLEKLARVLHPEIELP